jgi:hypothetical protein
MATESSAIRGRRIAVAWLGRPDIALAVFPPVGHELSEGPHARPCLALRPFARMARRVARLAATALPGLDLGYRLGVLGEDGVWAVGIKEAGEREQDNRAPLGGRAQAFVECPPCPAD